ncbi:ATP synthase protein 8 [Striga asiatica]|uniref:ATP synthase protein 8 n=1 Tax=Striga asiatica TaxID=4170 RepID=A0A5A7QS30_STRAF|nr:ATP synthase protein 8 [Striga asiatica]
MDRGRSFIHLRSLEARTIQDRLLSEEVELHGSDYPLASALTLLTSPTLCLLPFLIHNFFLYLPSVPRKTSQRKMLQWKWNQHPRIAAVSWPEVVGQGIALPSCFKHDSVKFVRNGQPFGFPMREPPIEMLRARLRTRGQLHLNYIDPGRLSTRFVPGEAYGANKRQLPLKIDADEGRRGAPILHSPDRKPGLADINRNTSRVKSVSLEDAIIYSYWGAIRFVLVLCAMIGFYVWWFALLYAFPGQASAPGNRYFGCKQFGSKALGPVLVRRRKEKDHRCQTGG